ncbi:hypothetical protein Tco_0796148 [Tanacetum coccineum]
MTQRLTLKLEAWLCRHITLHAIYNLGFTICLLDLGFVHTVTSNGISVSLNGIFYFSAIFVNDVFEIDMNENVSKLAHIGKTRKQKLQREGLLESIDDKTLKGLHIYLSLCIHVERDYRSGRGSYGYELPSENNSINSSRTESMGPPTGNIPVRRSERSTRVAMLDPDKDSIMYAVRAQGQTCIGFKNLVSRINRNPGNLTWDLLRLNHSEVMRNKERYDFSVWREKPDAELNVTVWIGRARSRTTIVMSCSKAEYMAASELAMEAVGLGNFVGVLGACLHKRTYNLFW